MSSAIDELRQTMVRLRADCPWDREQTHQSLARCLIDECSELLETIDRQDFPHMREELGDVLIQVVFHSLLAEEAGRFDFDDVVREINAKLIRRHPHVFGDGRLEHTSQVLSQWERIKEEEKPASANRAKMFKELPPRLPALMFAEAIWKQIGKKKLPAEGVVDGSTVASLASDLTDDELGRRLFELAAAARAHGLDPEGALRRYSDRVMSAIEGNAGAPSA
jgi:MazG family protein